LPVPRWPSAASAWCWTPWRCDGGRVWPTEVRWSLRTRCPEAGPSWESSD